MHGNTAWSGESTALRLVPALLPNTCSLSKRGPGTALLPEKTPDFNVYLSQVAALVDAPAGTAAPINQRSLWAVVTSIAFRQPDALLYTLFNSLFMWRLDIFYRASYYRT